MRLITCTFRKGSSKRKKSRVSVFIISAERPGPAFLPSNSCSHNCQIMKLQAISLLSLRKNTSLLSAAALSRRTNKNKLRYSLQAPGGKESGTVVASKYRQRRQPPTASGVPPTLISSLHLVIQKRPQKSACSCPAACWGSPLAGAEANTPLPYFPQANKLRIWVAFRMFDDGSLLSLFSPVGWSPWYAHSGSLLRPLSKIS